jgi:hypothetical protein
MANEDQNVKRVPATLGIMIGGFVTIAAIVTLLVVLL